MSEHFLEGAKLSGRDKPANLDVNMDNKPFFDASKSLEVMTKRIFGG